MTKQIRLIDKHTKGAQFDMTGFAAELAVMPCRDQLRTAKAITASHTPKDYPEPEGYEKFVIDNASEIAKLIIDYKEKSAHCPTICLDVYKFKIGSRLVDLLDE